MVQMTRAILTAIFLALINHSATAACSMYDPDANYPACGYSDFEVCAVGLKANGKWRDSVHRKEAKLRGLDCKKQAQIQKEAQLEAQKKKEAELKRIREANLREQQIEEAKAQLQIDKCLLEVISKYPDYKQSDAEYLCSVTAKYKNDEIMVNCLMDKGMNKGRRFVNAAVNVCVNIAENPSQFDLLRYGSQFGSYLRMFD